MRHVLIKVTLVILSIKQNNYNLSLKESIKWLEAISPLCSATDISLLWISDNVLDSVKFDCFAPSRCERWWEKQSRHRELAHNSAKPAHRSVSKARIEVGSLAVCSFKFTESLRKVVIVIPMSADTAYICKYFTCLHTQKCAIHNVSTKITLLSQQCVKLNFSVIWKISMFNNATNKFCQFKMPMTGLADVDGFIICIKVMHVIYPGLPTPENRSPYLRNPSVNFIPFDRKAMHTC